jgi:hypothetical protein
MKPEAAELIPLKLAIVLFQSRPSLPTIYRWTEDGVLVRGKIVKLRSRREGRRKFTTKKWCEEFNERCNEGGQDDEDQ